MQMFLPVKMRKEMDTFFDKHPEFKGEYPCGMGRNVSIDAIGDKIHRLTEQVASLEKTLAIQRLEHVDNEANIDVGSGFEKEWISYKELIELYDFRGVKSAKDPKWRKKNGFEDCVSQAGKGCAVTFIVAKVEAWLSSKKKLSRQKPKHRC